MSWAQVKTFNQAQAGTTKNFCLANVTKGYGIPNKYASAWQAWENTQQHGGDVPGGLDIPVYFSYTATIDGINKNWGHIGVRVANGQFWSDGNLYTSIADYTKNHSPKYVGWGESVNNVRVIKEGESMTDKNQIAAFTWAFFGRNARQTELDTYSKLPLQETINRILGSPEYLAYHENRDKAKPVPGATTLTPGTYQVK